MRKERIKSILIIFGINVLSFFAFATLSAQSNKLYLDPPKLIKSHEFAHGYSAESKRFTGISSFQIYPSHLPNEGILFVDHQKRGGSGHNRQAVIEYQKDHILEFCLHGSTGDLTWGDHGTHRLYVSSDNGATFTRRSDLTLDDECWYGDMARLDDNSIIAYGYLNRDEHNLQYVISKDDGHTWSSPATAAEKPAEGKISSFLGRQKFESQEIFIGQRFPNVVVTTQGTVMATWGRHQYLVRRSEDGGKTWGLEITVADGIPGWGHGGGVTVDESSGDIIVFLEPGTPGPFTVYRSSDDGRTWQAQDVVIHPLHRKESGLVPSMHMNEHGITLKFGERRGRLLRTTGNYMGGNVRGGPADAFCNAIYSDDGGRTWDTSAPFPAFGTNEAAVAELSDGRILFIARRHLGTDGLNTFMKHMAWSYDGGETWRNLRVSPVLPDGNTDSRYGLMHGLIRLPIHGRDILIFSNIESDTGRRNGTVWASFDGGETWPVKRLVDTGPFAYSSLAAGRHGTPSEGWIYLMYEVPGVGCRMTRFNLSWLLEGELTGDGELPNWINRKE